ncbi:hypothetical protein H4J02_11235 [Protaetiibacter sp. SSC-01]|uniref:DUF5719 family protein n=1 Tax=Protaetiibacter sp. SSC-01 TaxID=2759943 RepID=UPI001656C202|nr:DUF5719 family protein [Protaetiibacter sp. SSC-01]QNO37026.1 hypothetical protein H4J02_11235 [Protaetiibacter sp. SSC-01]
MADDERMDAETVTPEHGTPEPVTPEPGTPTGETPAAEAAAPETGEPAETPVPAPKRTPGAGRRATVVSLRIVRGIVGLAAAAAVVAAVGLVPLTTFGVEPLGTVVEPEPADLQTVCPGSLLRLGDESGGEAGSVFPVGTPTLTTAAEPGEPAASALAGGDASGSSTAQQPTTLVLPASESAVLAAAQRQDPGGQGGISGLAATACAEPTSSAWLVGGGTTVGRTSILHLVNPTAVAADVTLELWSESGQVRAPGMAGITVPAGGRLALPLSGFAPDLASPVVHVEARGGQVVAWLQTSVTRVLDPGGVDLVAAGSAPARELVIPAVRIHNATAVAGSLGIEGYDDLASIIRLGNPGDEVANVEVSLTPVTGGASPSTFEVSLAGGEVSDTPLEAAHELGEEILADGSYLVSVRSDVPVVAGVRTSTIDAPTQRGDGRLVPGDADLAWYASAAELREDAALAVASAASPVLVAVSVDGEAHTLQLVSLEGDGELTVEVPAIGAVAATLPGGSGYRIRGGEGVAAAVSFAGSGAIASYPVVSPRAADAPLVVRP